MSVVDDAGDICTRFTLRWQGVMEAKLRLADNSLYGLYMERESGCIRSRFEDYAYGFDGTILAQSLSVSDVLPAPELKDGVDRISTLPQHLLTPSSRSKNRRGRLTPPVPLRLLKRLLAVAAAEHSTERVGLAGVAFQFFGSGRGFNLKMLSEMGAFALSL